MSVCRTAAVAFVLALMAGCGGPDLPEVDRAGVLAAEDLPSPPESGEVRKLGVLAAGECGMRVVGMLDSPANDSQVIAYAGVDDNEVRSGAIRFATTTAAETMMADIEGAYEACVARDADVGMERLALDSRRFGWTVEGTNGRPSGAMAFAQVGPTIVGLRVSHSGDAKTVDIEPLVDRAVVLAEQG